MCNFFLINHLLLLKMPKEKGKKNSFKNKEKTSEIKWTRASLTGIQK